MKKYLIIALVIGLTACSDSFLEKLPTDSTVEENFYKTPEDAYEGLVSVYDALQVDYDGFTNYIIISEIVSDNCYSGGGTGDADNGLDVFRPRFDAFAPIWKKYFMAIYRANVLLSKLDDVDWGTDTELKTRYEAEARFLRAYFYFDLVRMFGNVPLITEPLSADQYYVPQAEPADVYKVIAEDLKFAIENLAATSFASIPTSEYGRANKWGAEGLLARVYLYYTDYYKTTDLAGVFTRAQVRTYVDDLIQNSGFGLVDDFSRLWRAANPSFIGENNKETVWAIKYTYKAFNDANKYDGSRWQVMVGLRSASSPPYGLGWGVGPVSQKLWDAYSTADKRRNASIISVQAEGITLAAKDQRQNTGFFWKKYIPYANADGNNATTDLGANFQNDNFEDYIVVRYSDVLLMAAELHLSEGGDITKAQTYFDQVRKRGFGVTTGAIDDATYNANYGRDLSGANAKSIIMDERRFELALEGHRYWDLIRQGMDVASNAIDNPTNDEFNAKFRPETKGLLAIPDTQINLSRSTLTQNTGW